VRDLTHKERKFADLILLGKTASAAHREAYHSKGSSRVIAVKAHTVRHRPAVEAYIAAEQAKTAEMPGATRAHKRRLLLAIMDDANEDTGRRIAAIQTDNLMCGDNRPVRFEGEIALAGIFASLQKTTGLPDAKEIRELAPSTSSASCR
jgi:hypothetical protein